jgi:hypothetical protein
MNNNTTKTGSGAEPDKALPLDVGQSNEQAERVIDSLRETGGDTVEQFDHVNTSGANSEQLSNQDTSSNNS